MKTKSLFAAATVLALGLLSARAARADVSAGYGKAIYLDGTGAYTGLAAPFQPADKSFTVEIWFRPTTVPSSGTSVILTQKGGTGTGRKWLSLENGKLTTNLGGCDLSGKTTVTAGSWHHAALTYERVTKRVYLYLDGVVDGVSTAFAESADGTMVLGADKTASANFFNGYLDELKLWTRRLGTLEIQQNMNVSGKSGSSELAAYYKFDSASSLSGLTVKHTNAAGTGTETIDATTCGTCLVTNDKSTFSTRTWTGSVKGYLPGSDSSGASVTFSVVSQGTLGTVTVTGSTGQFTYTASGSTKGTDSFTYQVASGATTQTRTMSVEVGQVNLRFTAQSGTDNPLWDYTNAGVFPTFVDMDGDGDLDMFTTDRSGTNLYYENVGTAYAPSYSLQSSSPIPLQYYCTELGTPACPTEAAFNLMTQEQLETVCGCGNTWYEMFSLYGISPAYPMVTYGFVDVDGDRDLDVYSVAHAYESLTLYKNNGSSSSPSFSESSTTYFSSSPSIGYDFHIADLTTMGQTSAYFVGDDLSSFVQTTSGDNFAAVSTSSISSSFHSVSSSMVDASLAAADVDGDGLWDAVAGAVWDEHGAAVYLNQGLYYLSSFSSSSALYPFDEEVSYMYPTYPALADLDGDGDMDMFLGGAAATYYLNDSKFYTVNNLPAASSVSVSGTLGTGYTLTGSYTFADADGDSESGTILQWYRASTSSGADSAAISGATSSTYQQGVSDSGKYVRFCVTPGDGIGTGTAACSGWKTVYPTLIWYTGASYTSVGVVSWYTKSASGTCVNVSGTYDNMYSSLKLYPPASGTVRITWYSNADCIGTSSFKDFSAGSIGTISDLSPLGFNDMISSFRVTY